MQHPLHIQQKMLKIYALKYRITKNAKKIVIKDLRTKKQQDFYKAGQAQKRKITFSLWPFAYFLPL